MAESGQRSIAGARCEFKVDGVIIAYATAVRGTVSIGRRPVRPLGSVWTKERPAVAGDCNFSVDTVRLRDLSPREEGLLGGRTTADLMNEGESIVEIFDRISKTPHETFYGSVPANYSFSLASGDVMGSSVSFEANSHNFKDEKPQEAV